MVSKDTVGFATFSGELADFAMLRIVETGRRLALFREGFLVVVLTCTGPLWGFV